MALGIPIKQDLIDKFFTIAESARNHKTSMLQHREQGKKMEIESLYKALLAINNDHEIS
ncbi:hypothetical protein L1N85_21335 [Paenibacillus alkaliterrae]|uniref:ketopantoate reductase family protein n=1 Tax=Paenibacillus alkaliterrae TaxID=320909 RepID=UPI001F1CBEAC|nr:ketopantoate reductase C-terminal domain-containing protein [Paenibacillus alkaliterrae]MCF2940934.1 hypothetical protein [Paenibacillus alkaliterrae]